MDAEESTSPASPPTEKMWSKRRKGREKALLSGSLAKTVKRRHAHERSRRRGEK